MYYKINNHITKFLTYKIILFLSITGCVVSKKNYSYKLTTYSVSNNIREELPFKMHLISFNDYLFEFKISMRKSDSLYLKSHKFFENTYYDTLGVYVLNPQTKRYFEFDTFSISNKVVKSGKFSEKEFGIKVNDSAVKTESFFQNKILKDTFLWDRNLYYMDTLQRGSTGKDSIRTQIYFMKDDNFISMYELNSTLHPNPEYSMVGYNSYFFDQNIRVIGALESMRQITEKETKICTRMIKEMKNLNRR